MREDLVDLAGLLQPVGATEALLPTITPKAPEIPKVLQPEIYIPRDDRLDDALDLVSQLLAEAKEATNASLPLEEININTDAAEITAPTGPAIDYTASPNQLILDHPRPKAQHYYKKLNS